MLMCGVLPALRRLRVETVVRGRTYFTRDGVPLWQRLWLDAACLAVAAAIFLKSASTNYQMVLATVLPSGSRGCGWHETPLYDIAVSWLIPSVPSAHDHYKTV